jgi:hypothetical protein
MGRRNYGPIPIGVWDLPELDDLTDAARAAFLSTFAVCCYHGRFHRDPRTLYRQIAWPKERLLALEAALMELEGLALIEQWGGSQDGRLVWVGHIIGYHGFEGLPDDRRYESKRPKHPSLPDKEDSLEDDWRPPGALRANPDSLQGHSRQSPESLHGVSRDTPESLQGVSRGSPGGLPASTVQDSRGQGSNPPYKGGQTRARMNLSERESLEILAKAHGTSVEQFEADCEDARLKRGKYAPVPLIPLPDEPEPEPEHQAPEAPLQPLSSEGQAMLAEYSRRVCSGDYGAGNHSGGFFAEDGASDLEVLLQRLQRDHPEAYRLACEGFWEHWDSVDERAAPRKPTRRLEEWLVEQGALPSVAEQIGLKVAGGG